MEISVGDGRFDVAVGWELLPPAKVDVVVDDVGLVTMLLQLLPAADEATEAG